MAIFFGSGALIINPLNFCGGVIIPADNSIPGGVHPHEIAFRDVHGFAFAGYPCNISRQRIAIIFPGSLRVYVSRIKVCRIKSIFVWRVNVIIMDFFNFVYNLIQLII